MGFPCSASTTRPTILPGPWACSGAPSSGIHRLSQEAKRGSFIEGGSVVGVVTIGPCADIGRQGKCRWWVAERLQGSKGWVTGSNAGPLLSRYIKTGNPVTCDPLLTPRFLHPLS